MIALAPREFHQFHAAGRHFLYLVPSAAIFELNQVAGAVIGLVSEASRSEDDVVDILADRFPAPAVRTAIEELHHVRRAASDLLSPAIKMTRAIEALSM